jgi:hypothetical protein
VRLRQRRAFRGEFPNLTACHISFAATPSFGDPTRGEGDPKARRCPLGRTSSAAKGRLSKSLKLTFTTKGPATGMSCRFLTHAGRPAKTQRAALHESWFMATSEFLWTVPFWGRTNSVKHWEELSRRVVYGGDLRTQRVGYLLHVLGRPPVQTKQRLLVLTSRVEVGCTWPPCHGGFTHAVHQLDGTGCWL